jgi:hypothetical protein
MGKSQAVQVVGELLDERDGPHGARLRGGLFADAERVVDGERLVTDIGPRECERSPGRRPAYAMSVTMQGESFIMSEGLTCSTPKGCQGFDQPSNPRVSVAGPGHPGP